MALFAYWLIKIIYAQLKALSPNTSERVKNSNMDPYEVLGLSRNATSEEKKKAYHAILAKYHPDKVEHLGEEIKKVAIEKTHQIQQAYNKLKD
jgi:preprotein translocase subunit Sec63